MCGPERGHNTPADVRDEALLLEQRGGILERRIQSDGNGGVIIDKSTGVSIAVVLALLGTVFGFFGAWAVPGIRMQQEIATHIKIDTEKMLDFEQRLRDLERFKAAGNRWSLESQLAYVREHERDHSEERTELMKALSEVTNKLAAVESRLQRIERKIP